MAPSNLEEQLRNNVDALANMEPDFDLGNGINKAELEAFIDEIRDKREKYNSLKEELNHLEKQAEDEMDRLIASVLAKFGRDSIQFKKMDGSNKSKIEFMKPSQNIYRDWYRKKFQNRN